jgi:hypothetical protein
MINSKLKNMGGLKMKLLNNNNHNYDYESNIEQGNKGNENIMDTCHSGRKKSFPFFLGSTVPTEWTIMNGELERKGRKRTKPILKHQLSTFLEGFWKAGKFSSIVILVYYAPFHTIPRKDDYNSK